MKKRDLKDKGNVITIKCDKGLYMWLENIAKTTGRPLGEVIKEGAKIGSPIWGRKIMKEKANQPSYIEDHVEDGNTGNTGITIEDKVRDGITIEDKVRDGITGNTGNTGITIEDKVSDGITGITVGLLPNHVSHSVIPNVDDSNICPNNKPICEELGCKCPK